MHSNITYAICYKKNVIFGSRKICMLFFLELYYSNVKFLIIILDIY